MIWMGEEFGEYKPKSMDPSKIDWTLLKNERNQALLTHYKSLIHLRRTREALQMNHCEFFHENREAQVLAYVRWNDHGQRVVVVVNFSTEPRPGYLVPNFPAAGEGRTWHDWTYNVDTAVAPEGLRTDLGALEAKVYVI
jgi:1,4-alpha-glucan branching enzyme